MDRSLDEICRRIIEIAPGLHSAGTFSQRAFNTIARGASKRKISNSVETGSGASTLLFSHLSSNHTVFALDAGSGSVVNIRRSPLLRADVVTFIEGPTQRTLPQYRFAEKLQLALIDGPHGYPFPDLEYYFLYPHLEAGALLIVDDIHIRSVHNLFEFLRRDAMFELDEVVGTTALFLRTSAPAFDPFGDGWWEQKYNQNLLMRYTWREKIKGLLPGPLRSASGQIRQRGPSNRPRCDVKIIAPGNGVLVPGSGWVEGSANLPPGAHLWVLIRRKDVSGWWPQGGGAAIIKDGHWKVSAGFGEPRDAGFGFEIAALVVGQATHELWTDWVARVRETGLFPPVQLPAARFLIGEAYRTVTRSMGVAT